MRARPGIGTLTLPLSAVTTAAYAGHVVIDRLDDPNFPHQGRRALLDAYLARRSLGSDASYDRVQGGIVQIFGRRRHQVFIGIEGGSNLGSDIPFYDQFSVGGLFSFSGFKVCVVEILTTEGSSLSAKSAKESGAGRAAAGRIPWGAPAGTMSSSAATAATAERRKLSENKNTWVNSSDRIGPRRKASHRARWIGREITGEAAGKPDASHTSASQ